MNIPKYLALEAGELDTNQALLFYSELILTGDIWLLSDKHVDFAAQLIEAGYIQTVHEQFQVN